MVSMLRRSWLIFATAAPSPASRSFWRSAAVSCTSQVVQRRLGLAQLARPALRRDDPARVLRVVAVGGHVLDHPADRPHDQPLHREEQQRRRGERQRERDEQDPQAVIDHRLPAAATRGA